MQGYFRKKLRPAKTGRKLVEEGGFEPPKPKQQIYSLPPLATRELFLIQAFAVKQKMELVDGLEPPTC